jgi:hypothetical protein
MKNNLTISKYGSDLVPILDQWTGVVRVRDGLSMASGVLLFTGVHILTTGHLIDGFNLQNGLVEFVVDGVIHERTIHSVVLHPEYRLESLGIYNDLGLIILNQAAPAFSERHEIYEGTDIIYREVDLVGYGQVQNPLGDLVSQNGERHAGKNTIDMYAGALAEKSFTGSLDKQLLFDYDDGTIASDTLGKLFGKSHLGLGADESMITPGDSGGGMFIEENNQSWLIGILSAVLSFPSADINNKADGSIADVGMAVNVQEYVEWIEARTRIVQRPKPEPSTVPTPEEISVGVFEGKATWFMVALEKPATKKVSVSFETFDGTAKAGQDYIATKGVIHLDPGEQWAKVWVQTLADQLDEPVENFYLKLTNPVDANLNNGAEELVASRDIMNVQGVSGVTQYEMDLFA